MNDHPERKDLLAAVKAGDNRLAGHFSHCQWCNLYFQLLSKYPFAGEISLPHAPFSWIEMAASLAVKHQKLKAIKSQIASIVFDSWTASLASGLRGDAAPQERRVKLESANFSLDLRAERRKSNWDFTARVTSPDSEVVRGTILAGRYKVMADENGFYQWSSAVPSKTLKLQIEEQVIDFPELSWKNPRNH
jgi:hypothetical protein